MKLKPELEWVTSTSALWLLIVFIVGMVIGLVEHLLTNGSLFGFLGGSVPIGIAIYYLSMRRKLLRSVPTNQSESNTKTPK